MYKELEQDYVISGETNLQYSSTQYCPYFVGFDMYEVGNDYRYCLPISVLVQLFLRSIGKHDKKLNIRINKIRVYHSQMRMNSVVHTAYLPDVYMDYHPITTFELRLGTAHNIITYTPPYNDVANDTNRFYDIDTKFFTFVSDPDSYEWDFTKGIYPPGYGTFMFYEYGNYKITGSIVPKGFYIASLVWNYRRVKILISVTIRDDI